MAFFRLQDQIPNVYVDYSRDFQVLCRAYDVSNNNVLYHTDMLRKVTDTSNCPTRLLPLLQEKLGFFSDKNFTNYELRTILEAFPVIVKNKGSLLGVQQCVNTYLKSQQLNTNVVITHSEDVKINGIYPNRKEYFISIGIQSASKNTDVLSETLKYVLPTGYMTYLYFYTNVDQVTKFTGANHNKATVLFITNNIQSALSSSGTTDVIYPPEAFPDSDLSQASKLANIVNATLIAGSSTIQKVEGGYTKTITKSDDIKKITIEQVAGETDRITVTIQEDEEHKIVRPTLDKETKVSKYVLFSRNSED